MKHRAIGALFILVAAAGGAKPRSESASARSPERLDSCVAVSPAVRAAAEEIYRVVLSVPGTVVEELEAVFRDERIGRDLAARILFVSGVWSELAGRSSPGDTLLQYLSERGWRQQPRFSADGPDGTFFALSKNDIWCFVRGRWDGGDDADSTYVPGDGYQFIIYCAEFDDRGRSDPRDER